MIRKKPRLSLILNVYNEEKNVEKVFYELIRILKKASISYQIIFAEGGSTDNSYNILKKIERKYPKSVVVLKTKSPPGAKIMAGFKIAKGKYVGFGCSDGQDDFSIIPKCVNILEGGETDFVKGRRINRENFKRLFVSRCYNFIANFLFSLESKDINGHPKIFRKEIIPTLNLKIKDEWIDLECLIRAKDLDLKLVEVPVIEKKRENGRSTADFNSTIRFFKHVFLYKFGRQSF